MKREPLLTVEEVAEITTLSVRTIQDYAARRLIVAHRFGRRLAFERKDVEQFLVEHRHTTVNRRR